MDGIGQAIESPDLSATGEEATRSPGASLAARRAERSLSLQDVAQRLKYGVRQLEALEQDEYAKLPGTTFVWGMIRSYAKLLELDAEPLLRELERRHIPAQVTVDLRSKRVPFPEGGKRGTRLYAVMSVLVVIAAAAVIIEWQFGELMPWNSPAWVAESKPAETRIAQAAPVPPDGATPNDVKLDTKSEPLPDAKSAATLAEAPAVSAAATLNEQKAPPAVPPAQAVPQPAPATPPPSLAAPATRPRPAAPGSPPTSC